MRSFPQKIPQFQSRIKTLQNSAEFCGYYWAHLSRILKYDKGRQGMEEDEKKGEEQPTVRSSIIRPAFKPLEGQRILDYDDETHRREIKDLLYRHFGEGRTVAADLLRIISSPGSNPRVINIHDNHISSHYAHYGRRHQKKKDGLVEVIDGEPEEDKDEYQEQLDKLTLAVGKIGQNMQDLQGMMKVRDGIVAAGDVEPPDVPRITEEELRSKIKELYPGEDVSFHPSPC